jgi:hypothetical protein
MSYQVPRIQNYKYFCLLECEAMQCGKLVLMFRGASPWIQTAEHSETSLLSTNCKAQRITYLHSHSHAKPQISSYIIKYKYLHCTKHRTRMWVQPSSRILKLAGWGSGKTKGEGRAWYEDSSCFMAEISVNNNTSPKYIDRYNIRRRQSHSNATGKCFWTGGICWVIYTRQAYTYPTLPAFLKYLPTIKIRELDCIYQSDTLFMAHPVDVAVSLRRQSIRNSSTGTSAAEPSRVQNVRQCCKQRKLITDPHKRRCLILNFTTVLPSALITMELNMFGEVNQHDSSIKAVYSLQLDLIW